MTRMLPRSKALYDISEYARIFKEYFADEGSDSTLEIVLGLVRAYLALERLQEESEVDLKFQDRSLILPHLRAAFRECLYLRSKMPEEMLDTLLLTRHGRIKLDGRKK